jgi:PKD repeat protein
MSHRLKIIIVLLGVFSATLLISWRGSVAQIFSSPLDNPEFWSKLSGVVVVDPDLLEDMSAGAPFLPADLGSLADWLLTVPVGFNVLANQDPTLQAQNEPSIVVNPYDSGHVIASSNDYRLRDLPDGDVRAGYYVSFDGGNTWPGDGIIDISSIPNTNAAGDPAMAIYDSNNVYFAYIAFSRDQDDAGGVFVSKSTDSGLTWNPPVAIAWNTLQVFHDKEYIAVDTSGSPYDGNLYMTWTRFATSYPIYFSRSTDGGATFSAPVQISDSGLTTCQGSIPAVGPNGEVYVAWLNYDTSAIRFARSLDGGMTWGGRTQVAPVTQLSCPFPGGNFRCNSFPTLAVDPNNGYLYVAWGDQRNGDADIYYSRSTDGGSSWSTATRLNDDPLGNDFHQFFPWMDVAPNGTLYAGWFDSRNDDNPYATPFYYDEYVTVSSDGGLTFEPNVRISEVSANAELQFSGTFIGDYSGIAATNDFVYPAWVDTRREHQDIYTQARLQEYTKTAPEMIHRFQPFMYSILLSSPVEYLDNTLTDPLPAEVTYIPGSLWASSGMADEAGGVISWQGDLSANVPVTITFEVTPTAYCSTQVVNTAVFTDTNGNSVPFEARSLVDGYLPVVDFEPSTLTPYQGEVVTFTNLSSGGPELSFLWDFGDGVTTTLESPLHSYEVAGTYTVTLTATDDCGEATHQEVLVVTCEAPQPLFTWQGGELGYIFTNQTDGQPPMEFAWDFGDGFTSTEESPSHTYDVPGPFTVTLMAENICGVGSFSAVVDAACSVPEAAFTWEADNLQASFMNESTGHFDLSFLWDFGDGLTSTLVSPVHDYLLPGIYTVTLAAGDLCGTGMWDDALALSCPAPEALFTYEANGLIVSFTDVSTATTPLSFDWDFGDGFTSTEQSPVHQYNSPGTYTVRLTVTEACGTDEYELAIQVTGETFLPMVTKH